MIASPQLPTRNDVAAAQFRYRYPYAIETINHRNRGAGPVKLGALIPITDEAVLDIRKCLL